MLESSIDINIDILTLNTRREHINPALKMLPEQVDTKGIVLAYESEVATETAENNTQKQVDRSTKHSMDITSVHAHCQGIVNQACTTTADEVHSTDGTYKHNVLIFLNSRKYSVSYDDVDTKNWETTTTKGKEELIDSKFAWVVAFSACLIGIILGGLSWSFGLLFKELIEYYGESRDYISLTQSAQNGTFLFIGPFTGYFISKFDCRKVGMTGSVILFTALLASSFAPSVYVLIVLYGLIGGIGYGLLYMPSITIVGQYFKKRRALATSIVCCGSSVGGLAFAPLMHVLLDRYGWRGSMMILSAICLNGLALSAIFRPFKHVSEAFPANKTFKTPVSYYPDTGEKSTELGFSIRDGDDKSPDIGVTIKDTDEKSTEVSVTIRVTEEKPTDNGNGKDSCLKVMLGLIKDPAFLCFSASGFFGMFSFYVPLMYLPQLADSVGMPASRGQFFVSAISLSNTVSRVLIGLLLDRKLIGTVPLFGSLMIIGGVATMCLKYFTSFALLMMYSIVFGSSGAAFITLRSLILADLFGANMLPYTFGLAIMFQGVSAFVGPPVIGAIIDATGNYTFSFFVAGVFLFVSGCLAFLIRRTKRWSDLNKVMKT